MNYNPPYIITNNIINLVSEIMNKIGEIKAYQDLDRLPKLRKENRIESIYSSCAIEANSLSIDQVRDIINGKQVVGPEKDITEIKNAIKAYESIEDIDPFNESDLLKYHGILTQGIIDESGKYRTNEEGVFNGKEVIFVAPPADMVKTNMSDLFEWMNKNKTVIHPLILSSVFHYELVFNHPFKDGNGRTARLFQTAILGTFYKIFYWIPIENEIKTNQESYYKAIDESNHKGESTSFIEFMLNVINNALDNLKKNTDIYQRNTNIYTKKLLSLMPLNVYMTSLELMELIGIKSKITLRKNYLDPAIEMGFIQMEFPSKPTSKNQRYIRVA